MNEPQPSPNGSDSRPPRVFISHRHQDSKIADVLRKFIRDCSAGAVEVFQSSYSGSGPEIGSLLTSELGKELDSAQVVILVYTVPDADWSYCMWETGVAFSPRRKDTKIVVLQCGQEAPAPLSDRARVQARDEQSVETFVKQFMTEAEFFSHLGRPVTQFDADAEEVQRAAQQLISDLEDVVPDEPDEKWPAWPFLVLELPLDQVDAIKSALQEDPRSDTDSILLEHCSIQYGDQYAAQLFGMPSFTANMRLGDLVSGWAGENPTSSSVWARSLLDQLRKACQWQFPGSKWALLRHADSPRWYAPLMFHVRRSPSKGCMQFEICFPRFDVDEESRRIECHLPED